MRVLCTALAGDVADAMMSQQYAHQPDVISNSLQHEAPPKHLHQLDAQCKDLGKWLRLSTLELKSRATALVAMSITAKHFSEQVSSLSVFTLKIYFTTALAVVL